MGIQTVKAGDDLNMLPVPPGFVPLTSFTLKSVEHDDENDSSMAFLSHFQTEPVSSSIDIEELKMALRSKPWIVRDQVNYNTEVTESEKLDTVTSGWYPEESYSNILEGGPTFYPTEEEFKDTLKYIEGIHQEAEQFGICRIVPPSSWQPPQCLIKETSAWEISKFKTQIQWVHELRNCFPKRKLKKKTNGKTQVNQKRALETSLKSWLRDSYTSNLDTDECYTSCGPELTLKTFKKYANDFKEHYFCKRAKLKCSENSSTAFHKQWEPTVENVEGEYWRIVDNPREEVGVLHAADIDTRTFRSGFPLASDSVGLPNYSNYVISGWNLNNISTLPGSLLSLESCRSDISIPKLYIGVCFSSLCWEQKVEMHHFYSICYMHFGDPKVCYGVPGRYFFKLKAVAKKIFPELAAHPELLQNVATQLSPFTLKSEGVPVYRCIQYPREFILFFPGAYHSGVDCGFNCSEVVNFAPFEWLPHGQHAVELYCEQGQKTSFSHDKVLLNAAMKAVRAQWEVSLVRNSKDNIQWKGVCGKTGILAKALKWRIKQESLKRQYLCKSSQSKRMDEDFDATNKRECCICLYDLHLSAVGCPCSPDRYSCLNHAKQLCSCPWSEKSFLFRYEINELNILLEAVEGKLSAIYKWVKGGLGLAIQSYITKDGAESSKPLRAFLSTENIRAETSNGVCKNLVPNLLIGKDSVTQATSLSESKQKEITRTFKVGSGSATGNGFPTQMNKPSKNLYENTSERPYLCNQLNSVSHQASGLGKHTAPNCSSAGLANVASEKGKEGNSAACVSNIVLLSDDEDN